MRTQSPAGCARGCASTPAAAACTRASARCRIIPTCTRTETSAASAAAVLWVRRAGTGHELRELRRGARLAPRILASGATVRAAFVPTQAGPLAGDEERARIVVGAGATLIVEPVAATLALPGPERTTLTVDVTVEAGGRL